MLRSTNTKAKAAIASKNTKTKKPVKSTKSAGLKAKKARNFSTSTSTLDTTLPLTSTSFKSTKKVLNRKNLAFPDDYDRENSPNPPERDPVFGVSKLISDLDPGFHKRVKEAQENPRKFDASEDEELYNILKQQQDDDNDGQPVKPGFEHYAKARSTLHHLNNSDIIDFSPKDANFEWLDPFNPPNLTYQHVKLLKNIDYSPLIKRANEGGMFSVEDVITIIQEEGISDAFKTSMRREHAQDPVIYGKTFDVFNRGRKPCPLCLPDPTINKVNRIHYTNVNLLRKFVSTSGMIIPRKVSGVCAMHQKKLRYAIKNSKQLALLAYTSNWHVPLSYVDPSKFDAYDDQIAAIDVERERRLEIKTLFDNLVNDKRAILAGKTLEQIEQDKQIEAIRAENLALGPDDPAIENTDEAKAAAERSTDWKVLGAQAKEDQYNARLKQLQDHYQGLIAKAGKDEDKVAQLKAAYAQEENNITKDYEDVVAEDQDDNMDQLRQDFGDLLDLEKFDIQMTFEEFLSKYNERIEAKNIKPADHADLIIYDSEDEANRTVGMKLRAQQAAQLQQDQPQDKM